MIVIGVLALTDVFGDLERWHWRLQQVKADPCRHPGGWWQVIYWRWKGLAAGDDDLAHDDPVLQVKVRRPTYDETLAAAIAEMPERSKDLHPHPDHSRRKAMPERMEAAVLEHAHRTRMGEDVPLSVPPGSDQDA